MANQRAIYFPFQVSNGSVRSTSDYNKIWQDRVLAAVGTAIGERPVDRVDYGTVMARTLWANVDEASQIATEQIPMAFAKHLPYLDLDTVDVYEVYEELIDTEYIEVEVNYILPNGEDVQSEVIIGSLNATGEVNVYESYNVPAYRPGTADDEED